ncbi:MAG: hypothetical protein OEY64_07190 [Nitrospinota bacterium]|nr:hypothetical protein [Nitrospinota bacterium]
MNVENAHIVDTYSMVLLFIIIAILILFQVVPSKYDRPLFLLFSIFVFQKYCLSILFMLLLPEYGRKEMVEAYQVYDSAQFNSILVYCIFGTILLGLGTKIGGSIANKKVFYENINFLDRLMLKINPAAILMIFLVLSSYSLYLNYYYSIGRHYSASVDTGLNFLNIFKNTSWIFYISLAYVSFFWGILKRYQKKIVILTIVLIIASSIAQGSRSYIYVYFILAILIKTVTGGDFKVAFKKTIFAILIIITAITSYPIALGIRNAGRAENYSVANLAKQIKYAYFANENPYGVMTMDIISRLTMIEPSFRILNDLEVNSVEDNVTVIGDIKRIINGMVPGDLFSDVIYHTRLYAYVYQGNYIRYNTVEWGYYEYCYALFGTFGGLIFVLFISAVLGSIWKLALIRNYGFKSILLVFFIMIYWTMLKNMGMSYVVANAVTEIFVFLFYLPVAWLLSQLMGKYYLRKKLLIVNKERVGQF